VPRFEPFRGLRYDPERVDLSAVTAPPYDVIDDDDRAELAARSPHNAVHVDLPLEEGDRTRYEVACRLLHAWQDEGVLVTDDEPAFYGYRLEYRDEQGRERHTAGILGALELSPPGEGDILPHEHTTPKARSDRLEMLRSCHANLSPIWGLSLAGGLSAHCRFDGPPLATAVDEQGVGHHLWRVTDPAAVKAIAAAVGSAPVVIADGHHRYETSLAYRDELRAEGRAEGPHDLVMTFVVELTEDELAVGPIHRALSGLPAGADIAGTLGQFFELEETSAPGPDLPARMDTAGALALVLPGPQTWLLRPRPDAFPDTADLDSSRLDLARAALPDHDVVYQHGVDNVVRLVERGAAQAAVLLRPTTVDQIARTAHARDRMPPKSTYFYPKLRTGLLFRSLDP
jgi:uncharacterized protein (DUF1015 family)